ncbi:MAG: class B sortase, partial [Clostridiales Family XIII bacterium]|nr:class B sortase [Clostridiales Family XIII bacterium]
MTKHILGLLIVVFAIVFCVSATVLIDHYLTGKKAEDAYVEMRRDVIPENVTEREYDTMQQALQKLRSQNNDFIGWLNVFDTGIDYPVVQTPRDQEYYLRRDFNGEYSIAGALFASGAADIEKPSDVIIIYGHNMKNGTMFGPLADYGKQSFYENHRYLRFDTLDERRVYEITNVFRVSYDDYTNEKTGLAYQNYADFADEADYEKFMRK